MGGHPALGNWQAEIAPNLHWGEGHLWTATVELPAGRPVEFKFLHVTHDRWVVGMRREYAEGLAGIVGTRCLPQAVADL